MLGTPVGFRSAFPECGAKDDKEIQTIANNVPKDIFDEVALCLPPLPKGATLNPAVSTQSDPLTGIGTPIGTTDPYAGIGIPVPTTPIPSNWTK
jgi:hypothetical protein